MADSGVRVSWASTIDGDVPPSPSKLQQQPLTEDHDLVISLPSYAGRYNTDAYFDWEFEVNHIFSCHDFTEHEKVSTAAQTFTDFASVWWDVYYKDNIDNKPTTWKDLKSVLRHRFVPSSYQREMLRKLERLEQGSNTVHIYYQDYKSYMCRWDIKDSEESISNMFFNGLNPDIQAMFKHIPRSIIGMYARACSFEKQMQEEMLDHYDPVGSCPTPPVVSANVARKTIVVRVAQPQICTTSPPRVPTSFESASQGKIKGTDFVPPHEIDERHVDLHISCVEIENDLVTPSILEDGAIDMNVSCDEKTKTDRKSVV